MRRIPVCILFYCLACILSAPGVRAEGPAVVRDTLWSKEALSAHQDEKRSGRLGPPDHSPPETTAFPQLPPLPEGLNGSIRRVNTHGAKRIALTFDLCELADQKSGYDGAVVDALRAAGARATFFAGGKWMRSHPERAMQLMADPLFEIGNHAWTHGNFGRLDGGAMQREIAWTQAEYALLRGRLVRQAREHGVTEAEIARIAPVPVLFRFPYGRCQPQALHMLASMGLAAVQWSLTTGDPDPASTPERILKNVLDRVRPGDIIIGHANGNGHGTGEVLPHLLAELQKRGYQFVTVSELLASGQPLIASDCYDSHPGDTARYDAIFGDGTTHPHRVPKKGPQPQPRPEAPVQQ